MISSEQFLKTKATKPEADHATDFEPPIYNIWKQQTKTEGSSHFGNSEVRWVDNLLYLYTAPRRHLIEGVIRPPRDRGCDHRSPRTRPGPPSCDERAVSFVDRRTARAEDIESSLKERL